MKAVGIDVGKSALDVAVYGEAQVQRYANTKAGIGRLMRELSCWGEIRIVVEATGGYEEAVLAGCAKHGLWIARVNPRQARSFANATGQLAKTDRLDARMLAEMAHTLHARLRAHTPLTDWQHELRGWLRRRHQVTETIQRTRQQLGTTLPAIRALVNRTLAALRREQALIDRTLKDLLQTHATPAMRSSKGMGPMFQASVLALLPELGQLTRRQIAKLVGIAPLNRDSGQSQGVRRIYGGRAEMRIALYMATLSAVRWDAVMKAHYQQLCVLSLHRQTRAHAVQVFRHREVLPPRRDPAQANICQPARERHRPRTGATLGNPAQARRRMHGLNGRANEAEVDALGDFRAVRQTRRGIGRD